MKRTIVIVYELIAKIFFTVFVCFLTKMSIKGHMDTDMDRPLPELPTVDMLLLAMDMLFLTTDMDMLL